MTDRQILAFVQSHDWGRGAYIEDNKLQGVIEAWTRDGKLFEEEISLPLNIKAIRDWAGY